MKFNLPLTRSQAELVRDLVEREKSLLMARRGTIPIQTFREMIDDLTEIGDYLSRLTPIVMDTWTVWASSGEYEVQAPDLGAAFAEFERTHPDDFVAAITNNDMNPLLVPAER